MRKIIAYCQPHLLAIDEVGYLSFSDRHADLLFDIVNRRYENKPMIITTNLPFNDWQRVFQNASCVVLVDRLVHHSKIFLIKGESYRLKEDTERSQSRQKVARKENKKSDSNTTQQAPLKAALSEEDRIGET
jgi:DNA replication protein DnaC